MTQQEKLQKAVDRWVDSDAFISGAYCADDNHPQVVVNLNDIWHDASEEPNIGSNIVVIDKDGRLWGINPYDDDYDRFGLEGWERCVYLYNDIQMWAYSSDLLPKGGEE